MSPRLTRRGWVVLAGPAVLLSALVVVVVVRSGGDGCTVTSGGQTVSLSRDDTEKAAIAVTDGRLRYGDDAAARTAVQRAIGLKGADGRLLAAALAGSAKAALVCDGFGAPDSESDRLNGEGLTARAERIREILRGRYRSMPLGGYAPGGVHSGHMPGSAHYEGRAIDAFSRPISAKNKVRGWALAQYLVARAKTLDIATVIFDGRIWTAEKADQGWRPYVVAAHGRSQATVNILEHRDHVHVDVFS
ncbi:MAG: hypothetical protein J7518_11710 [Nocardioidaceae bacterium]|nr:hypothetical protein [Nocardioidaceae bacterium]